MQKIWIICETCRTSCALHGPVATNVLHAPPVCPSCAKTMTTSSEAPTTTLRKAS